VPTANNIDNDAAIAAALAEAERGPPVPRTQIENDAALAAVLSASGGEPEPTARASGGQGVSQRTPAQTAPSGGGLRAGLGSGTEDDALIAALLAAEMESELEPQWPRPQDIRPISSYRDSARRQSEPNSVDRETRRLFTADTDEGFPRLPVQEVHRRTVELPRPRPPEDAEMWQTMPDFADLDDDRLEGREGVEGADGRRPPCGLTNLWNTASAAGESFIDDVSGWLRGPIDPDKACCVCMDRVADCCLIPCGHVNLCMTCSHKLPHPRRCPTCRTLIDEAVRAGARSVS
jgi:hypothetical protein